MKVSPPQWPQNENPRTATAGYWLIFLRILKWFEMLYDIIAISRKGPNN